MAKQEILLNHIFIKNRLAELDIKQWWLAEQIGVDRKTVTRWIQGQVKSIQIENAEKLSQLLNCSIGEFTVTNEAEQLATAEDQKIAAGYLVNSSVIDKLGPLGEWEVIESLLKAALVPNLPLNILGELYDSLTVASWRQSKIEQAETYNIKTLEIARKTNDKSLLATGLLSKANILSWHGQVAASIEAYQEALTLEKYIETRILGALYSNLGAVLYEAGDLSEGAIKINKSIEVFKDFGKPTNFSIAHAHLAMIALQEMNFDLAAKEIQTSLDFAHKDDYRRGLQMGKLILAEIAASQSRQADAIALVDEALKGFSDLGINEGLNYEYAGRVHRICKNLDQAEKYLLQGLPLAQDYPIYHASILAELAEVLKLKGHSEWKTRHQDSISIYTQCGCPLRILILQKRFGIS